MLDLRVSFGVGEARARGDKIHKVVDFVLHGCGHKLELERFDVWVDELRPGAAGDQLGKGRLFMCIGFVVLFRPDQKGSSEVHFMEVQREGKHGHVRCQLFGSRPPLGQCARGLLGLREGVLEEAAHELQGRPRLHLVLEGIQHSLFERNFGFIKVRLTIPTQNLGQNDIEKSELARQLEPLEHVVLEHRLESETEYGDLEHGELDVGAGGVRQRVESAVPVEVMHAELEGSLALEVRDCEQVLPLDCGKVVQRHVEAFLNQ